MESNKKTVNRVSSSRRTYEWLLPEDKALWLENIGEEWECPDYTYGEDCQCLCFSDDGLKVATGYGCYRKIPTTIDEQEQDADTLRDFTSGDYSSSADERRPAKNKRYYRRSKLSGADDIS